MIRALLQPVPLGECARGRYLHRSRRGPAPRSRRASVEGLWALCHRARGRHRPGHGCLGLVDRSSAAPIGGGGRTFLRGPGVARHGQSRTDHCRARWSAAGCKIRFSGDRAATWGRPEGARQGHCGRAGALWRDCRRFRCGPGVSRRGHGARRLGAGRVPSCGRNRYPVGEA